jgi:hypothetical protein
MKLSAWALLLTGAGLGLLWSGCAREPGELPPDMRNPVNLDDLTNGKCIKSCEPDYGSEPVDCHAAEYAYEFFPGGPPGGVEVSWPVWDFEAVPNGDGTPIAKEMYAYSDKTTTNLVTSNTCFVQTGDPAACDPNQYQPPTSPIERCGVQTHALHLRGGPFHEWGGGVGRRLYESGTTDNGDGFANNAAIAFAAANPGAGFSSGCALPSHRTAEDCAEVMPSSSPDPETCAALPPINPPLAGNAPWCPKPETCIDCAQGRPRSDDAGVENLNYTAYYTSQVDLREWDGISFWARRGPDSNRVLRVALGDKNTDDDMSFLMSQGGQQPRCGRAKECGCKDRERACHENPDLPGDFWCWSEKYDPPIQEISAMGSGAEDIGYVRCGASACNDEYEAYPGVGDFTFSTSEQPLRGYKSTNTCAYYTFANETNGYYCYDVENGPPPVYGSDKCGDPWAFPVTVNPDWTFYAIPFTDLHQDGYAKEFGAIDLTAVTMVRFLWGAGWIDFWIDDVRFYRRRPE